MEYRKNKSMSNTALNSLFWMTSAGRPTTEELPGESYTLMETVLHTQARFQNQMETCLPIEYCRPVSPKQL